MLQQKLEHVCKGKGGVKIRAKAWQAMLCCTWPRKLGQRAAQGSLDSHQICGKQKPWSSRKVLQPKEQQLGGCPPCSRNRDVQKAASPHSLYPNRGVKASPGRPQHIKSVQGGLKTRWRLLLRDLVAEVGVDSRGLYLPVAYTVSKTWIQCNSWGCSLACELWWLWMDAELCKLLLD